MARPILANSCARAATAAEARYRLDYPLALSRASRMVGLDRVALAVVWAVAKAPWQRARFYGIASPGPRVGGLELETADGGSVPLAGELAGVDSVILAAASDDGAQAAATIGKECRERGVMTAGVVLSSSDQAKRALNALRPYAQILMVPADEDDLTELLRAIRV